MSVGEGTDPPRLEEPEEELEFRWGKKRGKGGRKKDVQFYESFTYDGEEYTLYDCIYLHVGESPPYVAKILKIWENGDKTKRVKVQWFFFPIEIQSYLEGVDWMEKELFFASGDGVGLTNLNPLEAIAGKCSILCISKDSRNPQPSTEELQMADFVFYRTFDVGRCTISEQIAETVGGLDVKFVFNRKEHFDRLHSIRKDAFRETPNPQQMENVKLDGEDIETMSIQEESAPLRKPSGVDMKHDNCKDVISTIEKSSSLNAENAGGKVSAVEDKVQAIVLPINQVEDEVKFMSKSCTLDHEPPDQADNDGKVASSRDKATNGTSIPKKDSPQLIVGEKGDKSDFRQTERAANLDKPSSGLIKIQAKKSCDLTLEKWKFGDDIAQETMGTLSTKDLCHEGPTKKAKFEDFTRKRKVDDNDDNNTVTKLNKVLGGGHEDSNRKLKVDNNDDNNIDKKLKKILGRSDEDSNRKKDDVNNKFKKFGGIDGKSSPPRLSSDYADYDINDTKLHEDSCQRKGTRKKGKLEDSRWKSKVDDNDENDMVNKCKRKICEANHEIKGIDDSCREEGPTKRKKIEAFIGKPKGDDNNGIRKLKKVGASERKGSPIPLFSNADKGKPKIDDGPPKEHPNEKRGKLLNDLPKASITTSKDNVKKGQKFEVLPRPNENKSYWIKLSWEQKMKTAEEQGRLVLLLNLPPNYTSGEVEDIIWHALDEYCTAQVLPHTATSNPNSGQAFAVFKTRDAALKVVKRLDEKCLMLATRRPLVACIAALPKSVKKTTFFGHLGIDKARMQIQRELKDAVSTSHYSQNNTIEYEMAMLWCLQQSRSEECLKKLYEQQAKDMKKLTAALKSK